MSEHETPPPNREFGSDLRPVRREEVLFRASPSLNKGINSLLSEEFQTEDGHTFKAEHVAYFGMQYAISSRLHDQLEYRKENLAAIASKPLVVRSPHFEIAAPGAKFIRMYFEPFNQNYLDEITAQVTEIPGNLNREPERRNTHLLYTDIAINSLIPQNKRRGARESLYNHMERRPFLYSVNAQTITGQDVFRQERFLAPEVEELPVAFQDEATPDVA